MTAPSSPLAAHGTAAALGQLHRSPQRPVEHAAMSRRDGGWRLDRVPLEDAGGGGKPVAISFASGGPGVGAGGRQSLG